MSYLRTTSEHGGLPDIVVRLDRIPLEDKTVVEQTYGTQEPFERTFSATRYATARDRYGYRILRKRDSACGDS